jgi:hypothetical protein
VAGSAGSAGSAPEERCGDCGFAWGDIPTDEFAARLASLSDRYDALLASAPEDRLRAQPSAEVWSPLEYACHTRDMLLAQRERIYLTLVEERPGFARMYRDERVVLARYAQETPAAVRAELALSFRLAATALSGRSEADWGRRLIYNYPGPTEHDLAWMGRHTLHECEHHLVDIERGLARRPAAGG